MKEYLDLKKEIWHYAQKIYALGWVSGSSGNISIRLKGEDKFLITPSGIPYELLKPEQMVVVDKNGNLLPGSEHKPSVETILHLKVYEARDDVNAVIHTHSIYSSVLAVLRKPLPPILEELAIYTGGTIEVAEYAPSGSKELADNVVKALKNKSAVFLANHGNLCVGKDLLEAFNICALVERCSQIYLEALKVGEIHPIPHKHLQKALSIYEKKHLG